MLAGLHGRNGLQRFLALVAGILFGFLLQKGGVTSYDTIMGQLLLKDFTVMRIMLTAVGTGMAGVYILKSLGMARLHPKHGSLGKIIPGGIIFGAGFALLGYCPGTLAAAAGNGGLDAAIAGIPGMLAGTWLYALVYPLLNRGILKWGTLGSGSLAHYLKVPHSVMVPFAMLIIAGILYLLPD